MPRPAVLMDPEGLMASLMIAAEDFEDRAVNNGVTRLDAQHLMQIINQLELLGHGEEIVDAVFVDDDDI